MRYDDEPVFKRSKWGTNHYYYNPRNPIGVALIAITLLFGATMLILMANHAGPFEPDPAPMRWSPPRYDHSRGGPRWIRNSPRAMKRGSARPSHQNKG